MFAILRLMFVFCVALYFLGGAPATLALADEAEEAAPAETPSTDKSSNEKPAKEKPADEEPKETTAQDDLDAATALSVEAKTGEELKRIVELAESALEKGLDEQNEKFAKQLISSTLFHHASKFCEPIFDRQPPDPRWQLLRQYALEYLDKALKYDDASADCLMLKARLHALPGGDRGKATEALDKAVAALAENNEQRSQALLMRAILTEDNDRRMRDVQAAVEADPNNADALRTRAMLHMAGGDAEKALEDFQRLVQINGEDVLARQALAELLMNDEKTEEALEHLNKVIELQPENPMSYLLRARVLALKGEYDKAVADLDQVIKRQPKDPNALLLRGRLKAMQGDTDAAMADVNRLLEIQPGFIPAILLRSAVHASAKRFGDAIADVELVLRNDPLNTDLRLQLAAYLHADDRPRRAIEIYNEILSEEPELVDALRARADALLSIGEHARAVNDYEAGLKLDPNDSGILNNLAWVLATSPDDDVRDGKRSLELGLRACEVTEYKRPHILSTLAAGYAETGDWDKAVEWSAKAVELSEKDEKAVAGDDTLDQLKQEVESYREKKPWREKQETKEKEAAPPKESDLEL